MPTDYLDLKLGEFLDLSASGPAPGGGSAAAVAIALAASLVVKVARGSGGIWAEAPGVAAQAIELQARCPVLAREDDDAWQEALLALGGGRGDAELVGALNRAADLPLAIAATGADVAGLAKLAAERCEGELRGEAVAAAVLAHAGVRAAAHLVVMNLASRDGDDRCTRAELAEQAAAASVRDALEVGR